MARSNIVYAVTLHVTGENNLATVVGALAGSSTIVSIVPTKESAQPSSPPINGGPIKVTRQFHYEGGKKNKGITGLQLAESILNAAPLKVWDLQEVRNKFMERGFAYHSARPNLDALVRANKARNLGNNRFCAPGAIIHMGAANGGGNAQKS